MKTIRTTIALAAIVSLISPFLNAQNAPSGKDYFTIASEASTLTASASGEAAVPPSLPAVGKTAERGAPGGLVNAGMAAWSVINSGAPSGSYTSAYASAIPGFSFNWGNISGWKGPKEMIYRYTVTNLMGVKVIDVKYKISFYYGGTEDYSGQDKSMAGYAAQATGGTAARSDQKVHGHYITNFTVQPVSVNIKWGWHFDLAVRMSDPMNIGTKLAPVAALQASLNWIRSTPFSTDGGTFTYNVDGLGNFTDLTQQQRSLTKAIGPVEIPEAAPVKWN